MGDLPSGTLTFLFTDLEGSTALWEAQPDVMRDAVASHDELLAHAVTECGGQVVKTTGDGIVAVFVNATDGLAAALACQQALASEDWLVPIKARMGLYTGEAEAVAGDYHSPVLNRAARVMDAGHGGQVLVAASTAGVVGSGLPEEAELADLGEHRLRDLGQPEGLFQLCHPELERNFAPLRSLDAYPGNLPLQLSSFVGREEQLEWCRQALGQHRVLTLTGVGGVGKTRLAMQLAARVVPEFRDGAWLIELAPVRDRAGVAEAVASGLGVTLDSADTEASLVEALASKEVLLVLDNCEHVLAPVSGLVKNVLQSCPGVKVLATSREGMAILGEQIMAVPPLAVGEPNDPASVLLASDAVMLFTERAQAVNAEFSVSPDNADSIIEICLRLDGVPLAVELAAARVIALGPQDLARRLDRRFQMLAGGQRGAVERHATLRAAIDWSYDLLSEPEKLLLARLSVFAGTFDLDAAEAICTGGPVEEFAVLDLLAGLVAQSMVVAEQRSIGTRYKLLETIRQYGEEQLDSGDIAVLRDSHARRYTESTEVSLQEMWGPDGVVVNQRRAADDDNLLAAYNHAVDGADVDLAARLVSTPDWLRVGEYRLLPAAPVLALEGTSEHPLFPQVLLEAAYQARFAGNHDDANRYYQDAVATSEGREDLRRSDDFALGLHAFHMREHLDGGRYELASEAFGHGVEAARNHRSPGQFASHLASWVSIRQIGGLDTDVSREIAEEAIKLAHQARSPLAVASASGQLASVIADNEPRRATELLIEAIEIMGRPGQEMPQWMAAADLVALQLGHWRLALAMGARVLWLSRWSREPTLAAGQLACCARGVADTQPETAELLVGATYAAFRKAAPKAAADASPDPAAGSAQRDNPFLRALRQTHSIVAVALGEDQARALRTQGFDMDVDDAVNHVFAHINPLPVLTALDELKTQVAALSRPTPNDPGSGSSDAITLTDRQLEVAKLVARGLSNKDIARRLDVSPYTVETHVRNILERLDATNRTQIVAWVMSTQHE